MKPQDLTPRKNPNVRIEQVKRAVAVHFQVDASDLVKRDKTQWISSVRFVAYKLCREEGYSFQQIADAFKRRDHKTVMHGCRSIETFKHHPNIVKALEVLRRMIAEQPTPKAKGK